MKVTVVLVAIALTLAFDRAKNVYALPVDMMHARLVNAAQGHILDLRSSLEVDEGTARHAARKANAMTGVAIDAREDSEETYALITGHFIECQDDRQRDTLIKRAPSPVFGLSSLSKFSDTLQGLVRPPKSQLGKTPTSTSDISLSSGRLQDDSISDFGLLSPPRSPLYSPRSRSGSPISSSGESIAPVLSREQQLIRVQELRQAYDASKANLKALEAQRPPPDFEILEMARIDHRHLMRTFDAAREDLFRGKSPTEEGSLLMAIMRDPPRLMPRVSRPPGPVNALPNPAAGHPPLWPKPIPTHLEIHP